MVTEGVKSMPGAHVRDVEHLHHDAGDNESVLCDLVDKLLMHVFLIWSFTSKSISLGNHKWFVVSEHQTKCIL